MGWRVFGVKRNMPLDIPSYVDRLFRFELIEEALAVSDFVVSVLPETPETIGLYDISFFKKMKRTAIFCNVGRGSAVVDDDIELAVSSNLISGAILDAANRYSYKHPNILYTGHTSSISDTNDTKFNQYFRSQLTLFLTGKNPLNGIIL